LSNSANNNLSWDSVDKLLQERTSRINPRHTGFTADEMKRIAKLEEIAARLKREKMYKTDS
jgi:hypothetical protein